MTIPTTHPELATVLAAYLSKNTVALDDIPAVTEKLKQSLGLADEAAVEAGRVPARTLSAKEIRDAVQPDSVYCFEDGKRYKSMKRVLTTLGLTPETYRKKWGLPTDFPITAPNYSQQRRTIAKAKGFGKRKPAEAA